MLLKHALEFSKPNLSRVQKRQIYQKKTTTVGLYVLKTVTNASLKIFASSSVRDTF